MGKTLISPKEVIITNDEVSYRKFIDIISRGYIIGGLSKGNPASNNNNKHQIRQNVENLHYSCKTRKNTLSEYYKVKQLYVEGYSVTEIHKILGISRHTVKDWLKRNKRPKDIHLETIKRFNKWIEKKDWYKSEYFKIFYDSSKWPYLAYLYGATITDGSLFINRHKTYCVGITEEKIFLERVNQMVYKLIGRIYSIYKDKWSNRYITDITRKSLHNIMEKGIHGIKLFRTLI